MGKLSFVQKKHDPLYNAKFVRRQEMFYIGFSLVKKKMALDKNSSKLQTKKHETLRK